ncbi:hypothetical protein [Streptomyces sp. NBC_00986]|uniref:hypothetical protein n=1 Tax=Streptomyces sp. NBC_00986 TaxID=2903702 RepID=UPI00386D86E8|nr:hypothetical protein OG504_29680 [Streptomyces sp. NBC_00986]
MGDKGEILDIKIADLKATAPHFQTHSTDLAKALTKLRTALGAAGSPWGDDDQGTAFHKAYGPHVTQLENAAQIELVRAVFGRISVEGDKSEGDGR